MEIQTGSVTNPNNIVKERIGDTIVPYIRNLSIGTQITEESLLAEYRRAGGIASQTILKCYIHEIISYCSFHPDTSVEMVAIIKDAGGRDPRVQCNHHLLRHLESGTFERVQDIGDAKIGV